jgi:multiple sugar transport system permease protein
MRTSRSFLINALLSMWSIVCLFPLYWVMITSLKSGNDITSGPTYFPFFDFTPTLDAWRYILFDKADSILPSFFNSAIIGLASTLLTVTLGCMLVFGLTRSPKRSTWIMPFVLSSRILPPVVLTLPAYLMAATLHALDTWIALIIAYTVINLPVAVWLLHPVFGRRVTEQEEAASLEGVSQFGILFGIFLPMVAMSVVSISIVIFILCWNETILANALSSNQALTLPPFLEGQMSIKEAQVAGEAEEWSRFSAAAILLVMPLLVSLGLVQRALSKTVTHRQS